MQTGSVRDEIATIMRDQLNLDIPTATTDLLEAGILDSVAFIDLLMQLEVRFAITVTPDDLDFIHFRTVDTIAAFVVARLDAPAAEL